MATPRKDTARPSLSVLLIFYCISLFLRHWEGSCLLCSGQTAAGAVLVDARDEGLGGCTSQPGQANPLTCQYSSAAIALTQLLQRGTNTWERECPNPAHWHLPPGSPHTARKGFRCFLKCIYLTTWSPSFSNIGCSSWSSRKVNFLFPFFAHFLFVPVSLLCFWFLPRCKPAGFSWASKWRRPTGAGSSGRNSGWRERASLSSDAR